MFTWTVDKREIPEKNYGDSRGKRISRKRKEMAEERECLEREVRCWLRRENILKGKEVDEEKEILEREL
ncbi:MAG: hypothetical protein PUD85_03905 [Bacteroidales bacterium]|nr:hypothetical protein [Bacteroidales bacterium]